MLCGRLLGFYRRRSCLWLSYKPLRRLVERLSLFTLRCYPPPALGRLFLSSLQAFRACPLLPVVHPVLRDTGSNR